MAKGPAMVRSLALIVTVMLIAGASGVGCENDEIPGERSKTSTGEAGDESTTSDQAPPRVPGAPAEESNDGDAEARAIDRGCLRRAAGIAGWRDYLMRWSTGRYDVELPEREADARAGEGATLLIAPTRISFGGEVLAERETSDAGKPPQWTESNLETATEALAERTNESGVGLQVASAPSIRAAAVRRILGKLDPPSNSAVEFLVRDPSSPPPIDEPRPKDSWVEEMIATFERTSRTETRQQLLDDAIRRAVGRCGELRPLVDRIYEKDDALADRRSRQSKRQKSLVDVVASCPCREIDWTALEGLVVWPLQPLKYRVGIVRRSYKELPTSGDRSVGAFLEGATE